jgi:hypothetical protein
MFKVWDTKYEVQDTIYEAQPILGAKNKVRHTGCDIQCTYSNQDVIAFQVNRIHETPLL